MEPTTQLKQNLIASIASVIDSLSDDERTYKATVNTDMTFTIDSGNERYASLVTKREELLRKKFALQTQLHDADQELEKAELFALKKKKELHITYRTAYLELQEMEPEVIETEKHLVEEEHILNGQEMAVLRKIDSMTGLLQQLNQTEPITEKPQGTHSLNELLNMLHENVTKNYIPDETGQIQPIVVNQNTSDEKSSQANSTNDERNKFIVAM